MKWAGILFGGVALILLGKSRGAALREEVRLLACGRELILYASQELRIRRLPTGQILREAAESGRFAPLFFLKGAAERFTGREPLETVWREELGRQKGLSPAAESIFMEFGRILGSGSWDSQTASFEILQERVRSELAAAEMRLHTEGRLFQSLGVLAALFLAVLAI